MRMNWCGVLLVGAAVFGVAEAVRAQGGAGGQTVLIEAETFEGKGAGADSGPRRIVWGENDYKANFANANLSRQAGCQLGKVSPGTGAMETRRVVDVPADGVYRLLVRYEAPFGFDYGFEVTVKQGGKTFTRTFGKPESRKLWPFGEGMKSEVVWDWSANENIVWEGDDFEMKLEKGTATVTMCAVTAAEGRAQANRNIDCLILTSDLEGLKLRLEKETNMPLASWLTQAGDLWMRVTNKNATTALKVTIPEMAVPGPGEKREAVVVDVGAGETSGWVEVGGMLQTFTPGRWTLSAASPKPAKGAAAEPEWVVEFGGPAAGGPVSQKRFEVKGRALELAYEASLRDVGVEKGIKPIRDVLFGYLAELEKVNAPGKPATKVAVSGISFGYRQGDDEYNAAVDRFNAMLGLNAASGRGGKVVKAEPTAGVILPFGKSSREKMKETLEAMKAKDQLAGVAGFMIGSETANNLFAGAESDDGGYREFLKARGVKPSDLYAEFGEDWSRVLDQRHQMGARKQSLSERYYGELFDHELRVREVLKVSDALREFVPDALVAINFNSYMVPAEKGAPCLGPTFAFATAFRKKALTLPWVQDYMFWMPVGFHGMQFLNVDLMRAGIRHYPKQAMAASVMPQSPGNNPRAWRRMFYGHMAHGVNRFDLFQISPIQVGNPRYHVTDERMFAEIKRVTHELGTFDDLLVDSKVGAADVGFYFSEHGDVLGSWRGVEGMGKRAMYAGLKLANVPLDVVIEDDLYDGTLEKYKALVVMDAHVSEKAAAALKKWTEKGGLVIAGPPAVDSETSAAQPRGAWETMLGVRRTDLAFDEREEGKEFSWYQMQDLMNRKAIAESRPPGDRDAGLSVKTSAYIEGRAFELAKDGVGLAWFAVLGTKFHPNVSIVGTRREDGSYKTVTYGFWPGLQAFKSDRPIGRYEDFQTPGFKTITEILDPSVKALVKHMRERAMGVAKARVVNGEFIETGWVESKNGVVVPVIDWGNEAVKRKVTLELTGVGSGWKAFDACGRELKIEAGGRVTVEVDGAGCVVLRR